MVLLVLVAVWFAIEGLGMSYILHLYSSVEKHIMDYSWTNKIPTRKTAFYVTVASTTMVVLIAVYGFLITFLFFSFYLMLESDKLL